MRKFKSKHGVLPHSSPDREYDSDITHAANQIATAAEHIPALKAQLKDQATVNDIDAALAVYQKIFSPKQWNFACNLAAGMTKTEALREAGYSAPCVKNAEAVLDCHQSGVSNAYNLMLRRKYLTDVVSKRFCTSQLVAILEEARERAELKTAIACIRELVLLGGHRLPIDVNVNSAVSVSYELVNLNMGPAIKQIVADQEPSPAVIDVKPLSAAAEEFLNYAVPEVI